MSKKILKENFKLHPKLRWDEQDVDFIKQMAKNKLFKKLSKDIEEGMTYVIRFTTKKHNTCQGYEMLDAYIECQRIEELDPEEVAIWNAVGRA